MSARLTRTGQRTCGNSLGWHSAHAAKTNARASGIRRLSEERSVHDADTFAAYKKSGGSNFGQMRVVIRSKTTSKTMSRGGHDEILQSIGPIRKKRRPALSCSQCRQRKIRCDRNSPCQQCVKANIDDCFFVSDNRSTLVEAPFQAEDTHFSIFDQAFPAVPAPPPTQRSGSHDNTASNTAVESPGSCSVLGDQIFTIPPDPSDSEYSAYLSQALQRLYTDHDSPSLLDGVTLPDDTGSSSAISLYPDLTPAGFRSLSKLKFYGQSHWTNYMYQPPEVLQVLHEHETGAAFHGNATIASCKSISRMLKVQNLSAAHAPVPLRQIVPAREIADRLVQAYLRTFQTTFGILDMPSFQQGYSDFWSEIGPSSDEFVAILLLVMLIGSTFCPDEINIPLLSDSLCFSAVSTWLAFSTSNPIPSLDSLRLRCLLFLAQLARPSRCTDSAWTSNGTLLRMAISAGLHIDTERDSPDLMSLGHGEARRNLWTTVVELELQSSMDRGNVLAISTDDLALTFLDDSSDDISPLSLQRLLRRTLPVRIQIVRLLNGFTSGDSYSEALALSDQLMLALEGSKMLIDSRRVGGNGPIDFESRLFELLIHRFLLGLHHPYAIKAESDLSYHYSRSVCLNTALAMLSPSFNLNTDFYRLCFHGAGLFRDVYRQCALYLCRDLISQMQTHRQLPLNAGSLSVRHEARKAVGQYLTLTKARIESYDRSTRAYIMVSCLLAQADALETGAPVQEQVAATLKRNLDRCYACLILHV